MNSPSPGNADQPRHDAGAAQPQPPTQAQPQAQPQAQQQAGHTADPSDVRLHSSLAVRVVLLAVGTLALVLGVIGIFTPVLPTTPFILLAAACYARASTRFYRWLTAHRSFGPMILEWQRHRSIAYRTKLFAIASMAVTLGVSIVFFVEPPWLKAALGMFGAGLAAWLYRIPSRDAPLRSPVGPR